MPFGAQSKHALSEAEGDAVNQTAIRYKGLAQRFIASSLCVRCTKYLAQCPVQFSLGASRRMRRLYFGFPLSATAGRSITLFSVP